MITQGAPVVSYVKSMGFRPGHNSIYNGSNPLNLGLAIRKIALDQTHRTAEVHDYYNFNGTWGYLIISKTYTGT